MLQDSRAFSGFTVDDPEAARRFYGEALGLRVQDAGGPGMLMLHLAGDREVLIYGKPDHEPATSTILNFPVADVEAAVDELTRRGVTFERYEGAEQDERGIFRAEGPPIAWFRDPAGSVLSVLEG